MSDRLIIEFYSRVNSEQPVATVLALFGGDNPLSAATTLSDFFTRVSKLSRPRFDDAGLLAARFISWEGSKSAGADSLDFIDVVLQERVNVHGYQTARVYAQELRPYVHLVIDDYTACEELADAADVLSQRSVGPPIDVHT